MASAPRAGEGRSTGVATSEDSVTGVCQVDLGYERVATPSRSPFVRIEIGLGTRLAWSVGGTRCLDLVALNVESRRRG